MDQKDIAPESMPAPAPPPPPRAPSRGAQRQAAPEAPKAPPTYKVAAGLSISCARGHLLEGEPICADDLGGPAEERQAHLEHLVETGAVDKS